MDQETAELVKQEILEIAEDQDIELQSLIMFGSRVRDDYNKESDIDLLIISEDFEGIEWYKRGEEFQYRWDYEELPAPEIICLTPREFEERRKKTGNIVKTAFETGVEIA